MYNKTPWFSVGIYGNPVHEGWYEWIVRPALYGIPNPFMAYYYPKTKSFYMDKKDILNTFSGIFVNKTDKWRGILK